MEIKDFGKYLNSKDQVKSYFDVPFKGAAYQKKPNLVHPSKDKNQSYNMANLLGSNNLSTKSPGAIVGGPRPPAETTSLQI